MADELKLEDFDFEIASHQDLRDGHIDEGDYLKVWKVSSKREPLAVCVSIARDEHHEVVGWQFADTVVDRTVDLEALSDLIDHAIAVGCFDL
jgi:hypothetical protein